ncbi:MAG: RagB/SusD family nutrient uptake outer membrane protein [Parafilimonas sp.]|nr:RagB/SusD family nutrient uptake outer membrane protein [Parafilimonas sp.]
MKNLIKNISIASIPVIFLLSSCSKSFIEKNPFDSVPQGEAITDATSMQHALNGAYSGMRAVGVYGRDFPVIGDLQADNTFLEVNNSGRYIPQYQFNFTATDGTYDEIWKACYTVILRANQIIDADVSGDGVDAIKAQAYGLRGLMYFKLVNAYARPYTDDPSAMGVPLVLHYDAYAQPPRNSVKEVYDQIVSDLKKGFETADGYSNSVTLSKYAIEGLLARTYLYMGDNTNAKASAADVINNSEFSLVSANNYANFWADPGIHSDAVEVMFEIDQDVINNNGPDDLAGIYVDTYQDIYVSSDLYDLYSATDVRQTVMQPGSTKAGAPAVLVYKYQNENNTKDKDNIKVIRLSEVYLIAAEASLPGNEDDARMYLNAIAEIRDPGFNGYNSTGSELLNDIITERRKELAFEGDRYYDLNRLMRDVTRSPNAGAIPGPLEIPYTDFHRIAPIPQTELQANPNIEQNPGYQ